MFEIIDEFNTEDGAWIKCSCGLSMTIHYGSVRECDCGKQYQIKCTIEEIGE